MSHQEEHSTKYTVVVSFGLINCKPHRNLHGKVYAQFKGDGYYKTDKCELQISGRTALEVEADIKRVIAYIEGTYPGARMAAKASVIEQHSYLFKPIKKSKPQLALPAPAESLVFQA